MTGMLHLRLAFVCMEILTARIVVITGVRFSIRDTARLLDRLEWGCLD